MRKMRNLHISSSVIVPLIFLFSSCYGPVRFADRTNNSSVRSFVNDSSKIINALSYQSDSVQRFATDIEFTEEELEEIYSEDKSKPIRDLDLLLYKHKLIDTLHSLPTSYEKLLMTIIQYLGTPYKFGGNGSKGIDCSAFTQRVFLETFNIALPRSTTQQILLGTEIPRDQLKFGDLVFFNTRRRQVPGHVGIYLWDDYFAHASTKYGVVVSSMANGYYDKRFIIGKRIEEVYSIVNIE